MSRYGLILFIGRLWRWSADRWRKTGNYLYLYVFYWPMDWWYRPMLDRAIRREEMKKR